MAAFWYFRVAKGRTDALPDGQTAAPMKLTQGKLHVEQGQPAKQQHNAVRDEKRATAILIADVRKSPNIAQIHRKPNHRQQKLRLLAPGLPPSFTRQGHHKATLLATLQNLRRLGGGRVRWFARGRTSIRGRFFPGQGCRIGHGIGWLAVPSIGGRSVSAGCRREKLYLSVKYQASPWKSAGKIDTMMG
uniref:Uncharacterized protein n=1 Tax=Anopheles melas TaxID=34690 RepID=A0A182UL71_9DIPT